VLRQAYQRLWQEGINRRYGLRVLAATLAFSDSTALELEVSFSARGAVRRLILERLFRHGGKARSGLVALYRQLHFNHAERAGLRAWSALAG